ncbi:hypothetical protein P3N87_003526 [Salmonella enterica]|nr:hypothetical protein [Salmonella enterica]
MSRNNDFKGYWTINQLKLLAINYNLTTMDFSLTPPINAPHFNLIHYVELCFNLCVVEDRCSDNREALSIEIDLNPPAQ